MHQQTLGLCLLAAAELACQHAVVDHDSQRCADVSAQIEQALSEYTGAGVLLPGAEPCELTLEDFDPRIEPATAAYLLDAFASACELQSQVCWGVPPEFGPPIPAPPPAPPASSLPASAPPSSSPPAVSAAVVR